MDEMKCKNCMFFKYHYSDQGHCVRFPPQVIYDSCQDNYPSVSPEVKEGDFCGEFRPKDLVDQVSTLIQNIFSKGESNERNE